MPAKKAAAKKKTTAKKAKSKKSYIIEEYGTAKKAKVIDQHGQVRRIFSSVEEAEKYAFKRYGV